MSIAATIARFYGQGKEEKNAAGWVTLCPVHGDNRPSLSVKDAGDNDVDVFCHTGCDWKEIKDRFRADGLLSEWKPERRTTTGPTRKSSSPSTTSLNSSSTTKPSPTTQPVKEDDPSQSEKESYIWKQAGNDGLDHARTYLAGRAITMDLPVCLRWNSYKNKKTGEQCNIIVAAASKPTDTKVHAVQRLFIDLETHKKTGAKMHGTCEGRGVWFNRKGDLSEIIVGEGIETTLSAIQATGKNGVASLSTSGTKNLIFPDATETVYFLVDSDPVREKEQASMPGQKAAVIAAKAFVESRSGRKAYIVTPDDTCLTSSPTKIDLNDLLKQDPTGASIRARFDVATEIRDLAWEPPKQPESDDDLNDTAMVAEMFDRYVFLASENKIIDSHGYDIKDSMMIERAFIIAHAGKFYHFVDGEGEFKTIPLAQHWVNSGEKKIAAGMKYQPGEKRVFVNGDGRAYYNVFRFPYESMPPVPPEEIKDRIRPYSMLMDCVFHRHRRYIEDFFSFTIQRPSQRAGIMPVCISQVGLGKSQVMDIIARVVGFHNFTNSKVLDVTGLGKSGNQWGDWIYNKKLSCIEEIAPEGDSSISYQVVDALKDIITNETLPLNLKGGRNGTFPIYSNIMGFSNHQNCVKVPLGDRRIFVVDSTGQEKLSVEQYAEVFSWKAVEENIIALYQYLRDRKISDDFVPGQAKMTRAKKALQLDSRSPMQTAFDLVVEQYPCDLITESELALAVAQAMQVLEGGQLGEYGGLQSDKQFRAIKKTCTSLVAEGRRVRVRRKGGTTLNPCAVRALRNGQEWGGASVDEIKAAMEVEIPVKWIVEDDEVPF